jgi:hypothetical protein
VISSSTSAKPSAVSKLMQLLKSSTSSSFQLLTAQFTMLMVIWELIAQRRWQYWWHENSSEELPETLSASDGEQNESSNFCH